MGTKQVKMEFQVAANDGELAQVTVTAGGTQVFSGSLAQTLTLLFQAMFIITLSHSV